MFRQDEARLDASESLFFKRELERIDPIAYETMYPEYKARSLLPMQGGIDETDKVYTYRMFDTFGSARYYEGQSDDAPMADADGAEASITFKRVQSAYSWDIFELKAAAKVGRPLDEMKAKGCRRAIEEKLDSLLSLGDTLAGITGCLKLSNTTTVTAGTKALGGTAWGTVAAPTATAEEAANDVMALCSKVVENSKERVRRFRVVLPLPQYNFLLQKRMGDGSDVTALKYLMQASPYVQDVVPWFRCDTAGSGNATRMAALPVDDASILAALIGQDFQTLPPQERNLRMVINATATCGGVVCRYPFAVGYMDSI